MLRIFCTAAESRNFKEAATRLGVSPQAVTRAVKELEDHVGELLFHRNTRHNQQTQHTQQGRNRLSLPFREIIEACYSRKQKRESHDELYRIK